MSKPTDSAAGGAIPADPHMRQSMRRTLLQMAALLCDSPDGDVMAAREPFLAVADMIDQTRELIGAGLYDLAEKRLAAARDLFGLARGMGGEGRTDA